MVRVASSRASSPCGQLGQARAGRSSRRGPALGLLHLGQRRWADVLKPEAEAEVMAIQTHAQQHTEQTWEKWA